MGHRNQIQLKRQARSSNVTWRPRGRISDITGRGSSFPPLSNMDSIKTLKLLSSMIFVIFKLSTCLTGNKLTGSVPQWLLERNKNLEVLLQPKDFMFQKFPEKRTNKS
ncbi:hypothetical protein NC653_003813 [Populus alba x Populus x berolinensis]|uniref:Uncharacterized protein n=1 Tax=Populus alba x Populus x berolinensis TaxID=444605 RepID=A0AAD6WIS0_9ROSI|nr:hypothetical protein NC653_003813 [Populus alba x Populus x berolinensis]